MAGVVSPEEGNRRPVVQPAMAAGSEAAGADSLPHLGECPQAEAIWPLWLLYLAASRTENPGRCLGAIAHQSFLVYRDCPAWHRWGCIGWVLDVLLPGQWRCRRN